MCKVLGFEQPVCGPLKQGALLLALPTTVAFPEREAAVSQGCGEHPSVQFGWCKSVNHPQTFSAGWTKDGESGGPGGGVGRKPRLGCMKGQVALAKVKVQLEQIVPVQDRTENPVIIVRRVSWYLWRNLMGCDFFRSMSLISLVFFLHVTHTVTSLVVLNTKSR